MEYRKVVLLPLCCLIITVYDAMCSTNGMASRPFQGFPNILEVECSGEGLPPNKDLLSIALYDSEQNAVIASVNLAQDKCSTSGTFASCVVDRSNSRATLVKTLVLDLQFGSVRTYGCDVTTYQAGERPEFVSWSLAVEHPSLTTRAFQGYDHITEVACSGESLPSDTDLLSMVLYLLSDRKILATVNLKNNECSTADRFSSCLIDSRDSHRTKLTTLILDLKEHEAKGFGCNLTTFQTGQGANIVPWHLYATKPSMYHDIVCWPGILDLTADGRKVQNLMPAHI